MLIIDFSQVMISNLMMSFFKGGDPGTLQPDFLRSMILNTTRAIRVKFPQGQWGELILACDDTDYWRKDVFSHYKASRKKKRSDSGLDWKEIYKYLDMFKSEIKEVFPYRVVQVPKCEADDIIAAICIAYGKKGPLNTGEPIKIVSGDEDFKQLQVYGNVSQYDQIRKKDVVSTDPTVEARNLILLGDSGDGVPNVLSADNCLVDGIKQKSMRVARIQECINTPFAELPADVQKNWKRNEKLVDLHQIPAAYTRAILNEFGSEQGKKRDTMKIMQYMMAKRLKLLIEHIGEF